MRVEISSCDIFLNIAGGIRIAEPAADLAVAAALMSALSGHALPADTVFLGRLAGRGNSAGGARDLRMKEASKLGFKEAVIPKAKKPGKKAAKAGFSVQTLEHVQDLADLYVTRQVSGQVGADSAVRAV